MAAVEKFRLEPSASADFLTNKIFLCAGRSVKAVLYQLRELTQFLLANIFSLAQHVCMACQFTELRWGTTHENHHIKQ